MMKSLWIFDATTRERLPRYSQSDSGNIRLQVSALAKASVSVPPVPGVTVVTSFVATEFKTGKAIE